MIIKQTVDNNKRKDSTDEGHFKDVAPETSPVKMEQMIHTDQEPAGLEFIISIIFLFVFFHNLILRSPIFVKT